MVKYFAQGHTELGLTELGFKFKHENISLFLTAMPCHIIRVKPWNEAVWYSSIHAFA